MNLPVDSYPILQIDPASMEVTEQLGSKPKFWVRMDETRWLFKECRPNTGEHWAEKIAAELARLLRVPAAQVELADHEGTPGCACKSFITNRTGEFLIHGNELLAGTVTGYKKDQWFRQSDHTLDNIILALDSIFSSPEWKRHAYLHLTGYLFLDGLIGNTDRHHENWGVIFRVSKGPRLGIKMAPTFDHASSLGRELTNEAQERILSDGRMLQYLKKGRGGIYANSADRRGLSPLAVAQLASQRFPELYRAWAARLAKVDEPEFSCILDQVPAKVLPKVSRQFVAELLRTTRQELLSFIP